MKTTKNTILITGGSAGIGLEIAKLFANNNNTVIITGRNKERLAQTVANHPNLIPFQGDVNNFEDVQRLKTFIQSEYKHLNVLMNNAGNAFYYDVSETATYEKAKAEIETNYLSIINLIDEFLPILKLQPFASIVNVTSIVAFVPTIALPTYAASKAALHFYTTALRDKLKEHNSTIKVFEVMPPLVNTNFSKAIGGENGIAPQVVAQSLFEAFQKDQYEVPVGATTFVHQKITETLQNITLG
ncbi:SDR family oxidoreductase [Zhouia sp. PK063]|uniref:SDR family oxidoreductase n=1 Tax=Zhouia sp. PK063 TaxID=3373602 RepID=UPI00379D6AAF